MKILSVVVLILLVVACANPLNRETYRRYTEAGDQALANGRPDLAEQNYYRAAKNVEWGNLSPAEKSGALFNFANAKLRLGKFAEAVPLLLESLALEETVSGPSSAFTMKRHFGLAIAYLGSQQEEKGVPYLLKTVPFATSEEFFSVAERYYPPYQQWLIQHGRSSEASQLQAPK